MVPDSTLIRSTIEATASAHLHNLGVAPSDEPMRLQSKALRHLTDALSRANAPTETTIFQEELVSAMIILVYYETTFGLSALTARWHLLAICNILNDLSTRSFQSSRFDFLKRLFAYFDILVAFSLRLEPLANPRLFVSFLNTEVCPAFGYAFTLYPQLHSLACLLAQNHMSRESDLFNIQSVSELESELLCWQPPLSTEFSGTGVTSSRRENSNGWAAPEDRYTHERLLQTALAFRSAALLIVSVELLPSLSTAYPTSSSAPKTHYNELLDHLLRLNTIAQTSPLRSATLTPNGSDFPFHSHATFSNVDRESTPNIPPAFTVLASTSAPLNTVTWPLHTAALHAKTTSDRAVLSYMFERAYQRHRMGILGAAKRHAEEIWRRDVVEGTAIGAGENVAGGGTGGAAYDSITSTSHPLLA